MQLCENSLCMQALIELLKNTLIEGQNVFQYCRITSQETTPQYAKIGFGYQGQHFSIKGIFSDSTVGYHYLTAEQLTYQCWREGDNQKLDFSSNECEKILTLILNSEYIHTQACETYK